MEQRKDAENDQGCGGCVDAERRRAMGLVLATGLVAAVGPGRVARADGDPATLPPQTGDILVQASGEHRGDPIHPAEITGDEKVVQAWAIDPSSKTIRSGSRLNRVLLIRLDPASLDDETKKRAAEGGIVAYSDFCTHAGCWIETYRVKEGVIYCHCHGSMFDPKASAKVVGGPARQPLAGLPVKIDGDHLVVAGEFQGKLGIPKAGT